MPAKKGKKPEEKYPLNLTVKQRESLVHATRLPMGLKTRIKEASKDQQFVEFTKKELEKMGEEIYTSLAYVPPADRKRLNATLDKIDDLLDDLEGKHLIEKRQAVRLPCRLGLSRASRGTLVCPSSATSDAQPCHLSCCIHYALHPDRFDEERLDRLSETHHGGHKGFQ
jgi:hypothetical protein